MPGASLPSTTPHLQIVEALVASAKGYEAARVARRLPCYQAMRVNVYVDGFNLYYGKASFSKPASW
jgi:hypothetical protein